jgi:hypothetical protein
VTLDQALTQSGSRPAHLFDTDSLYDHSASHSIALPSGSGSVGHISVGPIKEAALHVTGGTSVHVGGVSGTEVVVRTGAYLRLLCSTPRVSSSPAWTQACGTERVKGSTAYIADVLSDSNRKALAATSHCLQKVS